MKEIIAFFVITFLLMACASKPSGPPRHCLSLGPFYSYTEINSIPVGAEFEILKDSRMEKLVYEAISQNKLLMAGIGSYAIFKIFSSIGSSDDVYYVFSPRKPKIKVTTSKEGKKTYTLKNAPSSFTYQLDDIKSRNYVYHEFKRFAPGYPTLYKENNNYRKWGIDGEKVKFHLWKYTLHRKGLLAPTFYLKEVVDMGEHPVTIGRKDMVASPVFTFIDMGSSVSQDMYILREDQINKVRSRVLLDNYKGELADDLNMLLAMGLLDNKDVEKYAKNNLDHNN